MFWGRNPPNWHVTVHLQIWLWAWRNRRVNELFWQSFRIIGAASKTAIGLVP